MEIRSTQEGSRVYQRRIQTFSMSLREARFFLEKKIGFQNNLFEEKS